jgi:arsenite oxidase small subunit
MHILEPLSLAPREEASEARFWREPQVFSSASPKSNGITSVADVNLNESRRNLLKVALMFPLVAIVALISSITRSLASSSPEPVQTSGFPRVKVANLNDLKLNAPLDFSYPLENEPNIIVKLGAKAQGGIGPGGDIVAFSLLCQHQGCRYNVSGSSGYCPCHASSFDLASGGAVTGGPALYPVPQVLLELDSSTGDIYATGMTPPTIYGHGSPGSNDVSYDLQGGTMVPEFPSLTLPLLATLVFAIGMTFIRRTFPQEPKPALKN